jgi:hypothetical protein
MLWTKDNANCDRCCHGECNRSKESEDVLYAVQSRIHVGQRPTAMLLMYLRVVFNEAEGEVVSIGLAFRCGSHVSRLLFTTPKFLALQ